MVENDADLLAQLNGAPSGMPPFVDAAPVPAPSREAQLTITPAPAGSPVAVADSVHATKAGGKGYKIRVKGEYYAYSPEGKGKTKKDYTAEFLLPSLDGALSVIKSKLLTPSLKKKYADFSAERTCFIIDATPLSPAMPKSNNLAYMDRAQLEDYVRASRPAIPVDLSSYPDVTHLREAIIDYIQTPDGFQAREAARQSQRILDKELADLNPELDLHP